jgi:hypothetical protein
MTRISSRLAWSFKWIPSLYLIGFAGVMLIFAFNGARQDWPILLVFALFLCGGALFHASLLHSNTYRVYDDGTRLIIRGGGLDWALPLNEVESVSLRRVRALRSNITYIVVRTLPSSPFAEEIAFMAPLAWWGDRAAMRILDSLQLRLNGLKARTIP